MVLNTNAMSYHHAYAANVQQNNYGEYNNDRLYLDSNRERSCGGGVGDEDDFDNIVMYDSEEDTDDASETEYRNHQRNGHSHNNNNTNGSNHELKEQMYQHKLARLNKELEELKQLIHPEYLRRVRKLEYQYKERLKLNDVSRDYMKECVEREFITDQKAAQKEYEEKRIEVKENIIADFEEKKRLIESEKNSLELNNDSMEIKPTVTRKLRRRPNDPVPVVEKRRKPATGQLLVYLLDDKEIDNDIKSIQRGKPVTTLQQNGVSSTSSSLYHGQLVNNSGSPPSGTGGLGMGSGTILLGSGGLLPADNLAQQQQQQQQQMYRDTRIEDGKLWYERRWFHRGQQVFVEGKDLARFPATISAIGNEVVWVKRQNDSKVRIPVSHLAKGKISIRRRAN